MESLDLLLGTRLKQQREARAIPARALARHLALRTSQLTAIEQGRRHLTPAQLLLACERLGCSVQDFMQDI